MTGLSDKSAFCLEALGAALRRGTPEIFNTDQGSQFTPTAFIERLQKRGVAVSMDGRGRAIDNVSIESAEGGWRTVKYEEVYLHDYADGWEAERRLKCFFDFYCNRRWHSSLNNRTPGEVYCNRG